MKKILSAIILLAMMLAIFTGCANETLAEPEEETTEFELKIEITSDDERIYEHMDYVFIPDNEVIGTWSVVDWVEKIDDFDPDVPNINKNELIWTRIRFFDIGTAALQFQGDVDDTLEKWTKGYLEFSAWQVIPAYTIKNINDVLYMFVEWKSGDYYVRRQDPRYYVFKKTSNRAIFGVPDYEDVRNKDIHVADFSDEPQKIRTLWFNEKTIFPPIQKLPALEKFHPEPIMEAGKNPGLGVRALHEQGITGKGVNVAIIDQPLYANHPEYAGKIIEYKNFNCESESSMHGPAVASLLVGETIGTAPGAKLYYAAAPSWTGDATHYADALDWIVETNKTLPDSEKIRVVSISAAPTPTNPDWTNGKIYLESVKRAKEAGILVLDCSQEHRIIGACGYDFSNPEEVTKCRSGFLSSPGWINKTDILAPVNYRTSAEVYREGEFSYQYTGEGGLSWAMPYAAGVLAMGWQVKPELTADEIMQILRDTAYVDASGLKYINPLAFIEYIQGQKN
ncbi:MAG: S8 family serine peptidase [Oscillospiraceae bacterium]|nr:S8 family serine peptidase [Oscillospiraceae bacterium]